MLEKGSQDLVKSFNYVSVRDKGLKLERRLETVRPVSMTRCRLFPTRTLESFSVFYENIMWTGETE